MKTEISEKLKSLRKSNNYTVKELAKQLNNHNLHFTTNNIYKWEEGITLPNLKTLKALSKIYKCGISYLINEDSSNIKNAFITPFELHLLQLFRNNFLFRSISMQLLKWYDNTYIEGTN